jgi:hypothetical protein
MLPHLLALPAPERGAEKFHYAVLDELSPSLARAPGWFTPTTTLQRRVTRARALATKAIAEARRRTRRRTPLPSQSAPADPFANVRRELREVVSSRPDHPAWALLDRTRTEDLLNRTDHDEVNRYYLWRIATLFGTP